MEVKKMRYLEKTRGNGLDRMMGADFLWATMKEIDLVTKMEEKKMRYLEKTRGKRLDRMMVVHLMWAAMKEIDLVIKMVKYYWKELRWGDSNLMVEMKEHWMLEKLEKLLGLMREQCKQHLLPQQHME